MFNNLLRLIKQRQIKYKYTAADLQCYDQYSLINSIYVSEFNNIIAEVILNHKIQQNIKMKTYI